MKSLRIAQVVPVYPPYRGGMGRIAEEYTARLHSRGHHVDVFTTARGDPPAKPREGEAHVARLRSVRFGNAGVVPGLLTRLRGYDIVHLHCPYFGGAEFVMARRWWNPRQPLVLTYHMDATASGIKGTIFDLHRRTVLPLIVGLTDRVLVSSLDYARASKLARIRGAAARTEVHPFGVDLLRFHPGEEPELRLGLGARHGEAILLFVGTLDSAHHFKGLPLLLEALAGLRHLQWRLVVVGDGPLRSSFAESARLRGIGSLVSFAGDVSDAALPRYYRAADAHLFPSTGQSEAYGLVTMEAAASGIPTVTANLPGVRTLVLDGETGWHIKAGDLLALRVTLERLLSDAEQRRHYGRSARRRAEVEFAWDPLIGRLERTYAGLIAERKT